MDVDNVKFKETESPQNLYFDFSLEFARFCELDCLHQSILSIEFSLLNSKIFMRHDPWVLYVLLNYCVLHDCLCAKYVLPT